MSLLHQVPQYLRKGCQLENLLLTEGIKFLEIQKQDVEVRVQNVESTLDLIPYQLTYKIYATWNEVS